MSTRTMCRASERPRLYDLAYDVFDVGAECAHIVALARKHGLRRLRRVLDLGCGTGHHARHFASTGLSVTAVDSDRDMIRHARRLTRADDGLRGDLQFLEGDMRTLAVSEPSDLAVCLGASFNSIVDEREAIATLAAVGAALRAGGVFVVELHDPETTYGSDRSAQWSVQWRHAHVQGRFSMTPASSGLFRWDIVVDADFASGPRRRALFRTRARPWARRDLSRLARAETSLELTGWHRLLEPGASPRVLAAFVRARGR